MRLFQFLLACIHIYVATFVLKEASGDWAVAELVGYIMWSSMRTQPDISKTHCAAPGSVYNGEQHLVS